jgi:hypothetical protein
VTRKAHEFRTREYTHLEKLTTRSLSVLHGCSDDGQDQAFWGYLVALSLPAFPMSQPALFLLASDAQSIYSIKSQPLLLSRRKPWSMVRGFGTWRCRSFCPSILARHPCQAPVPDTSTNSMRSSHEQSVNAKQPSVFHVGLPSLIL